MLNKAELLNADGASSRHESSSSRQREFLPLVDVVETQSGIELHLEVPGATDSTVEIGFEKNTLNIVARTKPRSFEGHELRYAEYEDGAYRRSFALAENIDADRIQAKLRDGVLRIELPRSPKAAARKIEVRAN